MVKAFKTLLFISLLSLNLFSISGCTSPDEDGISVLDEALDELDGGDGIAEEDSEEEEDTLEGEDGDIDGDLSLDEIEDDIVEGVEDDFSDEDEDPEVADALDGEDEDIDDFDEDEDDDDEDFADFDEDDDDEDMDDFDEDDDDEDFADFDEDDDEDFADFDEDDDEDDDFDDFDEDEDDEFAEDEMDDEESSPDGESAEAGEEGEQNYPETAEAQPQFRGEGQPVPVAPIEDGEESVIAGAQLDDVSVEEPLPQDDLGNPDPLITSTEVDVPSRDWIPVKKIKTEPFSRNGRLLNAVYIARPGDSLETISQKIFGIDKSSELLADNSYLQNGIDPGDKVYYTSTSRPADKSIIKVFYEDVGLQAKTYLTETNDDMRRLGSKLLGFQEGWKEIWAINPNVISKSGLTPGIELRYWKGDEGQMLAKASVDEDQPVFEEPPAFAEEVFDEPEIPQIEDLPPEPAFADVDPEPLPADDPSIAGLTDPNEGSLVGEVASEPEAREKAIRKNEDMSLGTIGMVALIILAGAGLLSIQIKNRKAQQMAPPSMEFTQV